MTTRFNSTPNDTAAKVTAHNYVRAESDFQMSGYIEKFNCFGKFVHVRAALRREQPGHRPRQRDTLYSWGVFDL